MLRLRATAQHGRALLRLDVRGERYDIMLSDPEAGGALGALVFFDDLTLDRLTTVERFWSAMAGKRVPRDPRLTLQRHHRARQMLRVFDGRYAGATYREIAAELFPKLEHGARTWIENPLREKTARLARDGLTLVRGGYRTLLRLPRRFDRRTTGSKITS